MKISFIEEYGNAGITGRDWDILKIAALYLVPISYLATIFVVYAMWRWLPLLIHIYRQRAVHRRARYADRADQEMVRHDVGNQRPAHPEIRGADQTHDRHDDHDIERG